MRGPGAALCKLDGAGISVVLVSFGEYCADSRFADSRSGKIPIASGVCAPADLTGGPLVHPAINGPSIQVVAEASKISAGSSEPRGL